MMSRSSSTTSRLESTLARYTRRRQDYWCHPPTNKFIGPGSTTHLNRLLVLRKDKRGKRFDFEVFKLEKRQLVQIHLEGGASLDLSLAIAETPHDSVLVITPHEFKLKKDTARRRRLLKDGGSGARITEVEIHRPNADPPERIDVEEGSVYLAFYLGAP